MNSNRIQRKKLLPVLALMLMLIASGTAAPLTRSKDKMTAEEVVAKNLASIGTPEARAAAKSQLAIGTVVSTLLIGGSGKLEGTSVLASQDSKSLIGLIFGLTTYPHEKMAFDGKDLSVAELTPGNYSSLGNFFKRYEMPFREGLFGGVLSTAWPLRDASRMSNFKYDGSKKIDGREVYVLKYQTKNDGGLKTKLYFDAETGRHVRSEYERRQAQTGTTQPGVTQQQGDAIVKLVEEFSDFKEEDGLTLPHTFKFQLSLESLRERYLQEWLVTLTKFVFNREMSNDEFNVKSSDKK